jgi:hypothetical protein
MDDAGELESDLSNKVMELAIFDGENRWLNWWPGVKARRQRLEEEVIEEMENFLDLIFEESEFAY